MGGGSRDYVHRVTGKPIENALQVPNDAIEIGQACVDTIAQNTGDYNLTWDGTCVVATPLTDPELLRKKLKHLRLHEVELTEVARIDLLTDAEVLIELGGA